MKIRKTAFSDIDSIMAIYEHARTFMAEHGNPNQWKSYVCENDGRIVGTFFYDCGDGIEPTYRMIEDGSWSSDRPYGVIHRIASAGSVKGVGQFCIDWALKKCPYLRIDTHSDNVVMQGLLKKNGFRYCGIIYVENGTSPRRAYDKITYGGTE